MRVIWTPEAQQDRVDIWDYIAADSPRAAVKMDELFSKAAARLSNHPKLGRSSRIPGTRELIPHKSYCLVYEIEQETVWVLALVAYSQAVAARGEHITAVLPTLATS